MLETQKRVWFLDELRGLVILLMIFYHTLYDIVFVFEKSTMNFYSPVLNLIQMFIATTFVTLSGIVSNYSKNNLKRGIQCLFFALILSLVTYFVMPSQIVIFGVLHLLGCCMLIYHFIQKPLKKIPVFVGAIIFLMLFAFTYNITSGFLGLFGIPMIHLSPTLYRYKLLSIMGFPSSEFHSSDYFPIIPWIFLYIFGTYVGIFFKSNRAPHFFYKPHIKPLAFLGRHSLLIYLLHQPVTYGILYLFFNR